MTTLSTPGEIPIPTLATPIRPSGTTTSADVYLENCSHHWQYMLFHIAKIGIPTSCNFTVIAQNNSNRKLILCGTF